MVFSYLSTKKVFKMGDKKPENQGEKILGKEVINEVIEDEMKSSYIDYAMSVIVGRALPNVKDGLKPVHRRILYAMHDMGLTYNKATKKSARIVGEVLGKYHPHGDQAVYDALIRMAQDFSLRYPLIKGQGNLGSLDGDRPAAMRYTEVKLAKISQEMLQDIDKETVEWSDNFDASLKEPYVLPSKIPNLLINGSSGIAVGMATSIPPHNILEVCEGTIKYIDNPDIDILELIETIKGPDFPTGGEICGRNGIIQAYTTGHGIIKLRSVIETEKKGNRERLIVKEIPYEVNKSDLIKEIANLVKNKKINEVSDLRDESDKDGVRIVIELKINSNPEIVKNILFKSTRLEDSFSINIVALVGKKPQRLNLKECIMHYVDHRKDIIIKRNNYELKKAKERAHILEGLIIALKNVDDIINLIRNSDSGADAEIKLMEKYSLTNIQSSAVLDMKLQKLASIEQKKIKDEFDDLTRKIEEIKEILSSEEKIKSIMKDELREIIEKYRDERKTAISEEEDDLQIEDLIKDEPAVVTMTNSGYIKRMSLENYKVQNRGGKGIIASDLREGDFIEHLFIANTHSYLLIFSDKGIIYWLKVWKIPESERYSKGKPLINFLELKPEDKIMALIPVKKFKEDSYLVMATKKGIVKKTSLEQYSRPRKGGIIGIHLDKGDDLVNVVLTDGNKDIILATKKGHAIRFDENNVRPMGRNTHGVIGIRLKKDDEVIGMVIADEDKKLLTVTENGYGKKTKIDDYRIIHRGGKGVINIKCSKRNGNVVSVKSVKEDDEIMLISREGILIRTSSDRISTIGRNTQGVRLMSLNENDKVKDITIIKEKDQGDSLEEDNQDNK